MRKIKIAVCAAMCAAVAAFMPACSVIDSITGADVETSSETASEVEESSGDNRTVDGSIAAPVFNAELNVSASMAQGSVYVLDGTADSPDGGEITYQWYSNNVASNGGGTAIEGATEATYTVDTSETGFKYYYVVASNNHGDSYNMATSQAAEMEVIKSGQWSTDEFGGTRYIADDGSYPTNKMMLIGTDTYSFDGNGYRLTGWHMVGEGYMYFDEEGRYQPDAVFPEGAYFDENGNFVQPVQEQAPPAEQTEQTEQAAAEGAAQ